MSTEDVDVVEHRGDLLGLHEGFFHVAEEVVDPEEDIVSHLLDSVRFDLTEARSQNSVGDDRAFYSHWRVNSFGNLSANENDFVDDYFASSIFFGHCDYTLSWLDFVGEFGVSQNRVDFFHVESRLSKIFTVIERQKMKRSQG